MKWLTFPHGCTVTQLDMKIVQRKHMNVHMCIHTHRNKHTLIWCHSWMADFCLKTEDFLAKSCSLDSSSFCMALTKQVLILSRKTMSLLMLDFIRLWVRPELVSAQFIPNNINILYFLMLHFKIIYLLFISWYVDLSAFLRNVTLQSCTRPAGKPCKQNEHGGICPSCDKIKAALNDKDDFELVIQYFFVLSTWKIAMTILSEVFLDRFIRISRWVSISRAAER